MEKIRSLNPEKEELTHEKLKELLGECNYSEEELKNFVFTIKTLVHIIIQYQLKQEKLIKEHEPLKIAA